MALVGVAPRVGETEELAGEQLVKLDLTQVIQMARGPLTEITGSTSMVCGSHAA